jgi:hypothetical protein
MVMALKAPPYNRPAAPARFACFAALAAALLVRASALLLLLLATPVLLPLLLLLVALLLWSWSGSNMASVTAMLTGALTTFMGDLRAAAAISRARATRRSSALLRNWWASLASW